MLNYQDKSNKEKINSLLKIYKTSTNLAKELQTTRMSLLSWTKSQHKKLREKNQSKIDFLWCKHILIPSLMEITDRVVIGESLDDLVNQNLLLDNFIKISSFGSLEIESNISKKDFDLVVEVGILPSNKSVKNVLEIHNIYTLNNNIIAEIKNNNIEINPARIKSWHKQLMSGIIDNNGQYSTKIRIIPALDIVLTHPDDIPEEIDYWFKEHKNAKTLTEIAKAHSHFELIHPFSDGNGRVGRSIMLAQCIKSNIIPPIINNNNKELYYATLEHSQVKGVYTALAEFLRISSLEFKKDMKKRSVSKLAKKSKFRLG